MNALPTLDLRKFTVTLIVIFAGGGLLFSQEKTQTLTAADGSSVLLKDGYFFTDVEKTELDGRTAGVVGPLFGENRQKRRAVILKTRVSTLPGITIIDQSGDVEEGMTIEALVKKNAKWEEEAARNGAEGMKLADRSETWIDFQNRKAWLVSLYFRTANGNPLYVRILSLRAGDSIFTFRCVSLGWKPVGWASSTISKISGE